MILSYSYVSINGDVSSNAVGFDPHAKTFMITKDGGYVTAGVGISSENANAKGKK